MLVYSNTVTVMFNQEGGLVTNKDEEMVREWKWPRDGKLAQPVIAQVIFIALLFLELFLPYFFFFDFTSSGPSEVS